MILYNNHCHFIFKISLILIQNTSFSYIFNIMNIENVYCMKQKISLGCPSCALYGSFENVLDHLFVRNGFAAEIGLERGYGLKLYERAAA